MEWKVGKEEIKDLGDERQYKSRRIDANCVWMRLKNFGVGIYKVVTQKIGGQSQKVGCLNLR